MIDWLHYSSGAFPAENAAIAARSAALGRYQIVSGAASVRSLEARGSYDAESADTNAEDLTELDASSLSGESAVGQDDEPLPQPDEDASVELKDAGAGERNAAAKGNENEDENGADDDTEDGKVPAVGVGAGNTSLLELLSSTIAPNPETTDAVVASTGGEGDAAAAATAAATEKLSGEADVIREEAIAEGGSENAVAEATAGDEAPENAASQETAELERADEETEDGKVPAVGVGAGNTSLLEVLSDAIEASAQPSASAIVVEAETTATESDDELETPSIEEQAGGEDGADGAVAGPTTDCVSQTSEAVPSEATAVVPIAAAATDEAEAPAAAALGSGDDSVEDTTAAESSVVEQANIAEDAGGAAASLEAADGEAAQREAYGSDALDGRDDATKAAGEEGEGEEAAVGEGAEETGPTEKAEHGGEERQDDISVVEAQDDATEAAEDGALSEDEIKANAEQADVSPVAKNAYQAAAVEPLALREEDAESAVAEDEIVPDVAPGDSVTLGMMDAPASPTDEAAPSPQDNILAAATSSTGQPYDASYGGDADQPMDEAAGVTVPESQELAAGSEAEHQDEAGLPDSIEPTTVTPIEDPQVLATAGDGEPTPVPPVVIEQPDGAESPDRASEEVATPAEVPAEEPPAPAEPEVAAAENPPAPEAASPLPEGDPDEQPPAPGAENPSPEGAAAEQPAPEEQPPAPEGQPPVPATVPAAENQPNSEPDNQPLDSESSEVIIPLGEDMTLVINATPPDPTQPADGAVIQAGVPCSEMTVTRTVTAVAA